MSVILQTMHQYTIGVKKVSNGCFLDTQKYFSALSLLQAVKADGGGQDNALNNHLGIRTNIH